MLEGMSHDLGAAHTLCTLNLVGPTKCPNKMHWTQVQPLIERITGQEQPKAKTLTYGRDSQDTIGYAARMCRCQLLAQRSKKLDDSSTVIHHLYRITLAAHVRSRC
jgi:hypothetical protein